MVEGLFLRNVRSEDKRYYLVKFVCEDEQGGRHSVYMRGLYTPRVFVRKEVKDNLKPLIEEALSKGWMTIDSPERGEEKVEVESIRTEGRTIVVKLLARNVSRVEEEIPEFTGRVYPKTSIESLTVWEMSEEILRYVRENKFYEFVELLQSFKPMVEERGITDFDGKTIHPLTMRTLLSELRIYSKGLLRTLKKESRTAILLDRSVSMANPWSLWEEESKMRIGGFLARVMQVLQCNNLLFSFGKDIKPEQDVEDVKPIDEETRLDKALEEVVSYDPERLIVLTDGRPVYSPNLETGELCKSCIEILDTMANSRGKILIVMLGRDWDMLKFYRMLEDKPMVTLVELSANEDVVEMMHKLSGWI